MTVKELIYELQKLPSNMDVYVWPGELVVEVTQEEMEFTDEVHKDLGAKEQVAMLHVI